MTDKKKFVGTIGKCVGETEFKYEDVSPAYGKDAPNIIYIVLDDLGFADLGCFGSEIRTPNMDAIAYDGLRFNNFHTTAICSATRASLLTGANHHAVGVGTLVDSKTGCPNGIGHIDNSYATVAEVLHYYDYRTFATGKWHLSQAMGESGDLSQWPLQRGFDRYYGFLSACGDQFHPTLVQDNTYTNPPKKEGYHLSEDLTDHAIRYIYESKMEHREEPFFLYLPYGAMHSPHHVPLAYADRYKGVYDVGWDEIRAQRFARQKELGVIPQDAELTDRNELVKAWADLSDDAKKVFARQMEVYAGFLEHTDEQIGRVIDYLKRIGQYDNTVIVLLSDNGASSEGGQAGRFIQLAHTTTVQDDSDSEEEIRLQLEHFDEIGTEKSFAHYPIGWANVGNTPFQWYKQWSYEGGTKDPLIIRYPKLYNDAGAVRDQYIHVSDITPTVLDIVGVQKPEILHGIPQKEMTGVSFKQAIENGAAEDRKLTQYYEMMGNRAIYHKGWKAVANHAFVESFDDDVWELYHVDEDYSENRNVADQYPEKLRELQDVWYAEAGRNNVFPMPDITGITHKLKDQFRLTASDEFPGEDEVFRDVLFPYQVERAFRVKYNSFSVSAEIERESEHTQGVIVQYGDRFTGFTFYIQDNRLKALFVRGDLNDIVLSSDVVLPVGKSTVKLIATHDKNRALKKVRLYIDETQVAEETLRFDAKFFPKIYLKANPYAPMGDYYETPFEFTGKIHEVRIQTAPSRLELEEELSAYFGED